MATNLRMTYQLIKMRRIIALVAIAAFALILLALWFRFYSFSAAQDVVRQAHYKVEFFFNEPPIVNKVVNLTVSISPLGFNGNDTNNDLLDDVTAELRLEDAIQLVGGDTIFSLANEPNDRPVNHTVAIKSRLTGDWIIVVIVSSPTGIRESYNLYLRTGQNFAEASRKPFNTPISQTAYEGND